MGKELTLPDVETASKQAIDTCYGGLIKHDNHLPQYCDKTPKKRGIQLIETYSSKRLKEHQI